MPLYDYECSNCGTQKEVQHSVSEIGKIEVLCGECNKPMKKMLSIPTLIGFDSVGRSLSRKDKSEEPKKDATTKETSKKGATVKDTSQKDEAA
jgi:putative FmdB family regulatory protein